MDGLVFERLVQIMEAIAGGDRAAVISLYDEFGSYITGAVRRHLRRFGGDNVDVAEVDGLVMDVCLDLSTRAASWDPDGGATPWQWADRRVGAMVSGYVGQYADELDAAHDDIESAQAPVDDGADVVELLDRVASMSGEAALLAEGLGLVASERDRSVFVEAKLQAAMGDRSPASTLAAVTGLKPAAVRQIVHRVRERLVALATADARFGPLLELAILA